MPVGARANRGERLQRWFAAWLAVLLAIAPFASPALLVELAPVSAAAEALVAHDDGGEQPTAGLRPAQASTLGILSRLSLLKTTLGLSPVKPLLLRPAADLPVPRLQAGAALGTDLRWILQRSSVGTARTPTGPPS